MSPKYYRLEDKHCWFIARRELVARLIASLNLASDSRILEIGCGGGALIHKLNGLGFRRVVGIDTSADAIRRCRQRDTSNALLMDGTACAFAEHTFDIVIAADVLEHIQDQDRALAHWRRLLTPGGRIILFVPAFQFLWSEHDEVNGHFRRYTKAGIVTALERNGFVVGRAGYWNCLLMLPVMTTRIGRRMLGRKRAGCEKDHFHEIGSVVNNVLLGLLRLENRLITSGVSLPFGVSVFAVGTSTLSSH